MRVEAGRDEHAGRAGTRRAAGRNSVVKHRAVVARRPAPPGSGSSRCSPARRPTPTSSAAPVPGIERVLVRRTCTARRAAPQKMSCVPLPWCTSQSTISTRAAPGGRAASAAIAALLSRQKPIARSGSAWWPGGRTSANAFCARPPITSLAPPRPRRRPPAAPRPSCPATSPCRDRAATRRARERRQRLAVRRRGEPPRSRRRSRRAAPRCSTPAIGRAPRSVCTASRRAGDSGCPAPGSCSRKRLSVMIDRAHARGLPLMRPRQLEAKHAFRRPGARERSTSPPWSRTISRTNARPRPVPFSRVVKNGAKIFSRSSGGTPGPSSRTSMRTPRRPASPRRRAATCPRARRG